MNEKKIKEILKNQQEYVNEAKRMADRGFLEKSALFLSGAKNCKEAIYALLMEVKSDERGLIRVTKQVLDKIQKNANNYYAKETQKIYLEGLEYYERKLKDWEFTKLMN